MANAGQVFLATMCFITKRLFSDGKYHKGNGTCSTTQWLLLLFWLFTIECFYHLGLQENQ